MRSTSASMGRLAGTLALMASLVIGAALPASAGGTKVTERKYGFTVTLPKNWQNIPLSGRDITGILNLLVKKDPSMKRVLTSEVDSALKHGMRLFALGPIHGSFAPNVNLIITPAQGPTSGATYFSEAQAQLKQALSEDGFGHVKTSIHRFSFGTEIVLTYKLSSTITPLPTYGVQLYIGHDGKLYIVTVTSYSKSSVDAAASVIEKSWHWR